MTTDAANDLFDCGGFKGWNAGLKYTLAKNMVATLEYVDFEGKDDNDNHESKVYWADVTFTF